MQSRKLRLVLALGAAFTLVAALAGPAAARSPAQSFTVEFEELNDSGARGRATLRELGGEVRVLLYADGLLPDALHLQHIHAGPACPTRAQDTNGDGFVDLAEGAVTYGGILTDLTDPEQDVGSTLNYRRSFDSPGDLDVRHLVVHGLDVDGDGDLDGQKDLNGDGMIGGTDDPTFNLTEAAFELTMPVLCGEAEVARR